MEYIDGSTLSQLRLKKPNQIFEVNDLKSWVRELCGALEHAHIEANLILGDVKPDNLMVDGAGHFKIADFGIARRISDRMTRFGSVPEATGIPIHSSPQQALGEKLKVTDDFYALGATLYDLLTSTPPFHTGDILIQVNQKLPPSMSMRRAELGIQGAAIPESWEKTVAACLSRDPAQRPQSAMEVAQNLSLAPPPTSTPPLTLPTPRPVEPVKPVPPSESAIANFFGLLRGHPVIATIGSIVAVGSAIGLIVLGLYRSRMSSSSPAQNHEEVRASVTPIKVRVPVLTGMELDQAIKRLSDEYHLLGERAESVAVSPDKLPNRIVAQDPPPDQIVDLGSHIKLTVGIPEPQPPSYEFRLRGGFSSEQILQKEGSSREFSRLVIVSFKLGDSPAAQGLLPGQGSWLDRGMRPSEPIRIEGDVPRELASQVAASLVQDPNAYWSFWIYNTNQGYFQITSPPTPIGGTAKIQVTPSAVEVDSTRKEVEERINLLPLMSAEGKKRLIDKMSKARWMKRLCVIRFDTGRRALSRTAADALLESFNQPEIRNKVSDPTVMLIVAGYADNAGSASTNLRISQERAENVSKILKERANLLNVIQTVGMGGTDILDSNEPNQNRAVEIWVLAPL